MRVCCVSSLTPTTTTKTPHTSGAVLPPENEHSTNRSREAQGDKQGRVNLLPVRVLVAVSAAPRRVGRSSQARLAP